MKKEALQVGKFLKKMKFELTFMRHLETANVILFFQNLTQEHSEFINSLVSEATNHKATSFLILLHNIIRLHSCQLSR
jgi:hypothetical protein